MDRCSGGKTRTPTPQQRGLFSSRRLIWRVSSPRRAYHRGHTSGAGSVAPVGIEEIWVHGGAELRHMNVFGLHTRFNQLVAIRAPQVQHPPAWHAIEPSPALRPNVPEV